MGSTGPEPDEDSGSYATVSAMRLLSFKSCARHFFSRRSHELYNSHREAGLAGQDRLTDSTGTRQITPNLGQHEPAHDNRFASYTR